MYVLLSVMSICNKHDDNNSGDVMYHWKAIASIGGYYCSGSCSEKIVTHCNTMNARDGVWKRGLYVI